MAQVVLKEPLTPHPRVIGRIGEKTRERILNQQHSIKDLRQAALDPLFPSAKSTFYSSNNGTEIVTGPLTEALYHHGIVDFDAGYYDYESRLPIDPHFSHANCTLSKQKKYPHTFTSIDYETVNKHQQNAPANILPPMIGLVP